MKVLWWNLSLSPRLVGQSCNPSVSLSCEWALSMLEFLICMILLELCLCETLLNWARYHRFLKKISQEMNAHLTGFFSPRLKMVFLWGRRRKLLLRHGLLCIMQYVLCNIIHRRIDGRMGGLTDAEIDPPLTAPCLSYGELGPVLVNPGWLWNFCRGFPLG